ncbi:MAG: menaquinone biosynthesis protein [Syntrophobacteraceae bacterium]|jgi:chorismate dehydratase
MGGRFTKLRLGRIDFLNVLPVYYPLESGVIANPFAIVPGVPSELNELCASGALDISPVSSIEYARRAELYYIVPDLSISSAGRVKSVLLLSRMPIEQLSGKTILASSQSHTSVGLLKVLSRLRYGVDLRFETGSCSAQLAGHEFPEACLAIGDEALRLGRSGLFPHVLDLGAAWFEWTGVPFVYAVWVIRKQTVTEKNGRIAGAVEALLSSKRWGRSNIGRICEQAAKTGLLELSEAQEYYSCLQFDLNERERKGLELFYSCLFQIGELERVPRLDIYTPLASVA